MRGFGGIVSIEIDTDITGIKKFLNNLAIFTLAESLGGVESLVNHPVTMSHASIPEKERLKIGITDALLRLSVGIEDIDDIIDSLTKALEVLD